jgi:hypothetical protein
MLLFRSSEGVFERRSDSFALAGGVRLVDLMRLSLLGLVLRLFLEMDPRRTLAKINVAEGRSDDTVEDDTWATIRRMTPGRLSGGSHPGDY